MMFYFCRKNRYSFLVTFWSGRVEKIKFNWKLKKRPGEEIKLHLSIPHHRIDLALWHFFYYSLNTWVLKDMKLKIRRKKKKNIRQPEQNVMTIGEFLLICFTWYPVMLIIPVDCLLILQIAWENKILLYAVREFV